MHQLPPWYILPAREDSVLSWEDVISVKSVGTQWTNAQCPSDSQGCDPSLQTCAPLELPLHGNLWELHLPQGTKKVIRYFEYYLWLKRCSSFHLCHDVSFLLNTTSFCFLQANIHLQSLIPVLKSTWTLCNSGLHRRILNSFQSFWSSSLCLHFK